MTDHPAHFATTHWTMVLAAGDRATTPQSRRALASLCEAYWYPLYAFVRRRGYGADEAADLTQAFFLRLLEKNDLAAADRQRGRFRSFLLAALKHFLANEWDHAHAQKRGGTRGGPISLDAAGADQRYRAEPTDALTPERIFERRWALTLLERVLAVLQSECGRDGKAELFEHLKSALTADPDAASYAATARQLGMTEAAVKVAVHRLRKRYREILRAAIADTVAAPADIDAEIRDLFAALSR